MSRSHRIPASLLILISLAACGSNTPGNGTEHTSAAGGSAGSSGAGGGAGSSGASSVGGSSGTGDAAGSTSGGSDAASGGTAGIGGSTTGGSDAGGSENACGGSSAGDGSMASCSACAKTACERCLCDKCSDRLTTCANTVGCPDVALCVRDSGCTGLDCYCGKFDAFSCAQGQADGPCKDVILQAPGGHPPTIASPSGGPAADAAAAIGKCQDTGGPCAADCGH